MGLHPNNNQGKATHMYLRQRERERERERERVAQTNFQGNTHVPIYQRERERERERESMKMHIISKGRVLFVASVYQRSRKAIILLMPAYFLIKKLIFSIKPSCKDGRQIIATNCRLRLIAFAEFVFCL